MNLPIRTPGQSLINIDFARSRFTDTIFADSHGAVDGFLGAGYLYYAFATALQSQVSVCIGSGGGFVPDLLAQAQRDLGIQPAATYLIDASLPDLGFGSPVQPGGWQRPENDFVSRADDILILPMLSADAVKLFAKQGVSIDYLHIDGDHSMRGVIADFVDYAPLLSDHAVVSLHDFNMESVRQAVDEIRARFPDWDFMNLAEAGVGSAFLRRKAAPAKPPATLARRATDAERRVLLTADTVAAEVTESAARSRFERWHYLETAAYRSRYQMIAGEIDRAGQTVVEIGGFPNSVVDFLHHSPRLYAIEPYAPPAYLDRIDKVAEQKRISFFLSQSTIAAPAFTAADLRPFALIWLGMDVNAACDSTEDFVASLSGLLDFVRNAEVVALEWSEFVPSMLIWKLVFDCVSPQIRMDIRLDLSSDPVAETFVVKDDRSKRRVVIFTAGNHAEVDCSDRILACAGRLAQIKARTAPPADAGEASLRFEFLAAELPANLGSSTEAAERVALAGADAPGCFTYGPYLRLKAGSYRLRLSYASPADSDDHVGDWDVCVGADDILANGPLIGTGGEVGVVEAEFNLSRDQSQHALEARTYFSGTEDMKIIDLAIEQHLA